MVFASVGVLGLAACQDDQNQNVPNRVLDRPLDLALACVEVVQCEPEDGCEGVRGAPRTISECGVRQTSSSCENTDTPQLVGFVANSERNEVAMFTECSGRLIDMDRATPGYQFVPVGTLPSSMTTSFDGCRVVTANAGSCDLSILDAPALATYGLGPDGAKEDEPSRFVSNLRPERFDATPDVGWIPVGARVGQVMAVRPELSGSQRVSDEPGIAGTCSPADSGSVYVTFPTCDAVAEVDLLTQRILQSFQFLDNGDGTYDVLDTGQNPICQVDCPTQFDGELPASTSAAPVPKVRPSTLEFVGPVLDPTSNATFPADEAILDNTLFVGGIGADVVFEIRMDDAGVWNPVVNQLELPNAAGVERIRATPAMRFPEQANLSDFQFLYVIAGDGSTRVVSRDFDENRDRVGVECETNPEPFTLDGGLGVSPCLPVTPTPDGTAPADRATTAEGPGIRPRSGGRITDWFFSRVPRVSEGEDVAQIFQGVEGEVTGLGVTSLGAVIGVKFQQYAKLPVSPPDGQDPLGLLQHYLPPHTLDPAQMPRDRLLIDSASAEFANQLNQDNVDGLPLVNNQAPATSIPGDPGPVRFLSPGLRRIDWAYSADNPENDDEFGSDDAPRTRASLLGDVTNQDGLGGEELYVEEPDQDGAALFNEPVPRIAARDYRRWRAGEWELSWDAEIPRTSSATGVLTCADDALGWPNDDGIGDANFENAYCRPSDVGDARLVDASARFCDAGVLPGDKLLIVGCNDDGDCGPGRGCLQATSAGGDSTGVCVSLSSLEDHEDRLREICEEFIEDPCGEALREYEILEATQTELSIGPLERPVTSFVRGRKVDDDYSPDDFSNGIVEEVGQFVCTDTQPDGGCSTHADCNEIIEFDENGNPTEPIESGERAWCIDGSCQRRCNRQFEECLLRQVPGPACFQELVVYNVRVHNQFLLSGPGDDAVFFTDRVLVDQDDPDATCRPATDSDQVSGLLTSRIPLGPTADALGIPECPSDINTIVNPGDPNPCLITTPRGDGTTPFHQMAFGGQTVTAIRFSNPFFTIVIDLVDLTALTREVDNHEDSVWTPEFASFRRSRIPRGYRVRFSTQAGYLAFEENNPGTQSGITSTNLIFPVRVVGRSPNVATDQYRFAFIIDAAGTGTNTGLRGQVLRAAYASQQGGLVDPSFDGVR